MTHPKDHHTVFLKPKYLNEFFTKEDSQADNKAQPQSSEKWALGQLVYRFIFIFGSKPIITRVFIEG